MNASQRSLNAFRTMEKERDEWKAKAEALAVENTAYKSGEMMEFLRLVECMTGDHNDSNHGDSQEWIRHIAKASSDFEDKHGDTPWGRMKGLAAINIDAAIAEINRPIFEAMAELAGSMLNDAINLKGKEATAFTICADRTAKLSANLRNSRKV